MITDHTILIKRYLYQREILRKECLLASQQLANIILTLLIPMDISCGSIKLTWDGSLYMYIKILSIQCVPKFISNKRVF